MISEAVWILTSSKAASLETFTLIPGTSIADPCYEEAGGVSMEPGVWLYPQIPGIHYVPLPCQAQTPASITSQCTEAWQPSGSSWAWHGWRWSSH